MLPLLLALQLSEPPGWDRLATVVPVSLLLVVLAALLVFAGVRRRKYRRALEESRERYRNFFEDDLTGDFLLDPSGRIADCNPAFARICGYPSPAAAIGREVWELLPDRSAGFSALRALRASGRLERLEMSLRARDGRPLHVVANLVASFDDRRELVQIRGYLHDDTVRKELERRLVEARRIEAVGRLAGGIAHEFNNLLASVTGYASLLLDDMEPDDPRRADLEAILQAGHRGSDLTGRLLAFGRKRVIRPSVIEVNEGVRALEPILQRTCAEGCTIRSRYTLDLPRVRADPDHLEQVLVHLVLNARDAMDGVGTIRISTGVEQVTEDVAEERDGAVQGSYVVLEVRDHGRGMTEEERNRMFEPFFTTKGDGTDSGGLGLSMVYGLVRQNGGFLDVESAPGKGTRVRVYLPALASAHAGHVEAGSAPAVGVPQVSPGAGGPPSGKEASDPVLVVDGEEVVRQLAERTLRAQGFDVLTARTGSEAIRRLRRSSAGPPRLVLAGADLPDGTGASLVERLRDESGVHPRVLYLMSPHRPQRGSPGGPGDPPEIPRTFTPETLIGAVRTALADD